QPITIPNFRTTYEADYVGPIDDITNFRQFNLGKDDQLFFQVSSESPIDIKQIKNFRPNVQYFNYCRTDTLSANSNDFTGQTTFCGPLINCASATGCEIAGDPKANTNHIAATTALQDITPYFQLKPWEQVGLPTGFVPLSDGTISFSSAFQGPLNSPA